MKLNRRLVEIENLTVEEPVKGKKATINIEVILPDTAWKLEKPQVLINNDEKRIQIRISAKRNPKDMGLQVITKRKIQQMITFQSSGKWLIECNEKKKIIEIRDKEFENEKE